MAPTHLFSEAAQGDIAGYIVETVLHGSSHTGRVSDVPAATFPTTRLDPFSVHDELTQLFVCAKICVWS